MVRDPGWVVTVCVTVYWSFVICRTTVRVPSRFEENANLVPGSYAVPSGRAPIGTVAITLPESASMTAIFPLLQTENNRRFSRSRANPLGPSHGASGHLVLTVSVLESI